MSGVGLNVGNLPVKQVYVGSTPVTAVYVGAEKIWPSRDVVDIPLGAGFVARDAFRAALTARGLDFATVTELPFDINLTGSGDALHLFYGCHSLTTVPPLNTSQVTNMNGMFQECGSLVTVPPLDTRNVVRAPSMFAYCHSLTSVPTMNAVNMVDVSYMFVGCVALTDGNVLLINKHPNVATTGMIDGSGLTREPWDTAPPPTAEVYEVTLTNVSGGGTVHPLVSVTVPAGETWSVRIQGTVTKASGIDVLQPFFRIGTANSGKYGPGAAVDFSGTVTSANSTIALVGNDATGTSFTGTVTIEK